MLLVIIKIILYIPFWIIYPVIVKGRKNLPKGEGYILTPNHQTLNDAVIVAVRLWTRFSYMAKAPLFSNKVLGWFLRRFGAYPVHQPNADLSAVKHTLKLLKNNKPLCIFPEGIRIETSEENALKDGVAMFALRTKSKIVPAQFIRKTNMFVPNKLVIGKPFNLSEMEEFKDKKVDRELLGKASLIISDQMHQVRRDYHAKKTKKIKETNKTKKIDAIKKIEETNKTKKIDTIKKIEEIKKIKGTKKIKKTKNSKRKEKNGIIN